ncbi:MAG TPA: hypothetical protein VFZ95_09985 [Steroidobacteraceae bacterium]
MEKLTSVLAVAEDLSSGTVVLDKAVQLAREFGAHVELLVADPAWVHPLALRCVQHGFTEVTLCPAPHNTREPLHKFLLRRIEERQPDILVKAPNAAHPLRASAIDPGDVELVDRCPIPLLLVRMKAWSTPLRVAAAVDISDPETARVARGVLQSAGFLALGFHGHLDILYTERELEDDTLRMARAVKLAQLVREYHVGCERLQMFDGLPETRLPPLIAARQYDVVVLGAVTHRDGVRLRETLTSRLFEATEGDVLLSKSSRAVARVAAHMPSNRQQVSHQAEELF